MGILEIISLINSKEESVKSMAVKLETSERALKKRIKEEGYAWKGNKYILSSEIATETTTSDSKSVKKVKATYTLDKEIQRLIKLQSIIEDVDNSTIIERAINKYVSDATKETLRKL